MDRLISSRARRGALCGLTLLSAFVAGARADDPDNCLLCHQFRGLSRAESDGGRVRLFYVEPELVVHGGGPHARLACTDCHADDTTRTIPHGEISAVDCTRTCHLQNPGGVARIFSHQHVADLLATSVHSFETLNTIELPRGDALQDGQSRCLLCHDEPVFRDLRHVLPPSARTGEAAFSRCDACHTAQLPTDTPYFLRHVASRLQPARAPLEQAQICAVCHSAAPVRERFELGDAVVGYIRSFHGKAALLHADHTATCVDCHVARGENVHQMLSHTNPASATHADNVADACRSVTCHPGADVGLAAAAVHLDLFEARGSIEYIVAAFFIILTVLTFGPSLVIVVLELFALIVGRHTYADARVEFLAHELMETPEGRRRLTRFSVNQRVQHWVLAVFFAALVVTGFPMKFADQPWAEATISMFGGLGNARLIHHWGGIALALGMIFHLVYVAWTVLQRMRRSRARGESGSMLAALTSLPMWVTVEDGRKMFHLLGYLLFLRKDRPTFGRFGVKEKFEYIGVFWGTALLGLTGAMLWGEQLASHLFSGRILNIALIAHTYEAFLAVIHVGILHIVNVIFSPNVFPLSLATITGKTPLAELAENHADFVQEAAESPGTAGDAP